MSLTLPELYDKLKEVDELTLLELLRIEEPKERQTPGMRL
jgi:hypothetical protein